MTYEQVYVFCILFQDFDNIEDHDCMGLDSNLYNW